MALPVFNEGTQRYHDPESKLMMKTSVAESILAASKPTLTAQSTALAPVSNQLATVDPTPMSPMESTMAIFQSMADSLTNIESLLLEQVTLQEDQTALEMRDESISDADVIDPPSNPPGPEDEKGPGFVKRLAGKFSIAKLLKGGFILALTGIMAFADEFAKLLEPVLKFIKEKAWPNAVDVFTDFMEKGRQLFGSLSDKLSVIFGSSEGPHGVTLLERVKAFGGIFTDIGGFILSIGNSLITNVLEAFGANFDPYDTAGEWVLGKLTDMWNGIKGWFTAAAAKWPLLGDIGTWVLGKVTAAFQGISDFFSAAIGVYKVDGLTGVWSWLLDKVSTGFISIYNWFSTDAALTFAIDSAKGIFSWVVSKVGAVWDIIKGWFGFGSDKDKTETVDLEKEKENFSLFGLAKSAASAVWSALTGLFSFSPSEIMANIKQDLVNMGTFFKALAVGGFEALQAILPFGETPQDAFKRGFDSVMQGGVAGADISIAPGMALGERAETLAFESGRLNSGGGYVIQSFDNSTNTNSTNNGDTLVADLGSDHEEPTVKPAGNKEHLQNK
jgi:hypothetical protein